MWLRVFYEYLFRVFAPLFTKKAQSSMGVFDVDSACQHALTCLERDLSPELVYHSVAHTRDDVAPAAERLAALAGITGAALLLLRTAAYYHDLGYIVQAVNHEAISVQFAATALPSFGYTPTQIAVVSDLIMATRLPQRPLTMLEQVLADADLDMLGREDFWSGNQRLRVELAAQGKLFTDPEWYQNQLHFLQAHSYFTDAARQTRDSGKQRNIAQLYALLAQTNDR